MLRVEIARTTANSHNAQFGIFRWSLTPSTTLKRETASKLAKALSAVTKLWKSEKSATVDLTTMNAEIVVATLELSASMIWHWTRLPKDAVVARELNAVQVRDHVAIQIAAPLFHQNFAQSAAKNRIVRGAHTAMELLASVLSQDREKTKRNAIMELNFASAENVPDRFVSAGTKLNGEQLLIIFLILLFIKYFSASSAQLKQVSISVDCVNSHVKTVKTCQRVDRPASLDIFMDCQKRE